MEISETHFFQCAEKGTTLPLGALMLGFPGGATLL